MYCSGAIGHPTGRFIFALSTEFHLHCFINFRNNPLRSFNPLKYWYNSLVRYGKSASDDTAFNDIAFNDIAERPIFAHDLGSHLDNSLNWSAPTAAFYLYYSTTILYQYP